MDDWDLDPPASDKVRSLESSPAAASASPSETEPGLNRLRKRDVSPPECDGHAQDKDARSVNSSAIHATEDAALRRSVRSGGRDFAFQQPTKLTTVAPEPAVKSGTPRVPAPARSGRRVPLILVAAGLALLLVGLLAGFFVARSQAGDEKAALAQTRQELSSVQKALSAAEERNWNYYRENEALEARIEDLEPENLVSTPPTVDFDGVAPPGTYSDGVYLVGEDIPVGTYDGVVVSAQGYWARLKGTDGLVSQIIANAIPRGSFVLTIVGSDKAVELRGVELTAR